MVAACGYDEPNTNTCETSLCYNIVWLLLPGSHTLPFSLPHKTCLAHFACLICPSIIHHLLDAAAPRLPTVFF